MCFTGEIEKGYWMIIMWIFKYKFSFCKRKKKITIEKCQASRWQKFKFGILEDKLECLSKKKIRIISWETWNSKPSSTEDYINQEMDLTLVGGRAAKRKKQEENFRNYTKRDYLYFNCRLRKKDQREGDRDHQFSS